MTEQGQVRDHAALFDNATTEGAQYAPRECNESVVPARLQPPSVSSSASRSHAWRASGTRRRPSVSAALVMLLVALPGTGIVKGGDVALLATAPEQARQTARTAPSSGYSLDAGDRINLRIFERDDLSGEYRVRSNGVIVIPIVGTVSVAGKDETEVERDVAAALERVTGGRATVIVEVLEWRPFYVAGYVVKPGSYGFLPGMTVLHAMAIAGGVFRTVPAAETANVAATRESGRMQVSLDELVRLRARLDRLEAERDGSRQPKPSARLIELAGVKRASELMADEERIAVQNEATFAERLQALRRMRELAAGEVAALEEKIGQIDSQISQNGAVLSDLKDLLARQLTRRVRVVEVGNMIAALEAGRRDAVAAVARARRTLTDADRDIALLELQRQGELEAQILEVRKQVEAAELAVQGSKYVIEAITNAPVTLPGENAEPSVSYAILRKGHEGNTLIAADELTPLQPGDVLRVSRLNSAAAP